jgi:hypothetical protein
MQDGFHAEPMAVCNLANRWKPVAWMEKPALNLSLKVVCQEQVGRALALAD